MQIHFDLVFMVLICWGLFAFGLEIAGFAFLTQLVGGVPSLVLDIFIGCVGAHIVLTKNGLRGRAAPVTRICTPLGWSVRTSA